MGLKCSTCCSHLDANDPTFRKHLQRNTAKKLVESSSDTEETDDNYLRSLEDEKKNIDNTLIIIPPIPSSINNLCGQYSFRKTLSSSPSIPTTPSIQEIKYDDNNSLSTPNTPILPRMAYDASNFTPSNSNSSQSSSISYLSDTLSINNVVHNSTEYEINITLEDRLEGCSNTKNIFITTSKK